MGLDGGTYITRSDVLRGQSWAMANADTSRSTRGGNIGASSVYQRSKLDKKSEQHSRWSSCTLSGEPLQNPIAADFLGRLYNREAVIQFLLGRAAVFEDDAALHRFTNQLREFGTALAHLQSTKDIFTVHLTERSTGAEDVQIANTSETPRFECPITHLPCDRYPFSAISTCGHVFSDRALQQVSDQTCSTCGESYAADDCIPLNGSAEQEATLRQRRKQRREKKHKKRKGLITAADGVSGIEAGDAAASQEVETHISKRPAIKI